MYKALILVFAVLILAACNLVGSYYEPEPVGIGKDVYELKLSPLCLYRGGTAEDAAGLVPGNELN